MLALPVLRIVIMCIGGWAEPGLGAMPLREDAVCLLTRTSSCGDYSKLGGRGNGSGSHLADSYEPLNVLG